jgi:AcrR family transcriptional regulator
MPTPLLSKDEVIGRLMRVFRTFGYSGATLARISDATGLGKASLYHHFPGGKEDMARATLDRVESTVRTFVVDELRKPGAPAARLARMLANLDDLYCGGRERCILGNLTMSEAREQFQAQLKHVFRLWIDALAELAREAGVAERDAAERAEQAVLEIQGALILSAALQTRQPFRRIVESLPNKLLAAKASA